MATHPITRNRHFCGRLLLLLCTIAVLQIVGSAKAGEEKAAPAELIRKSVIAGTWYPASPQDLQKAIRTFMAPIPERETGKELIALISPHAGYAYSGQVAAYGYNLLKHKKFETVVVIAPSHHAVFEGVSVYDRGGYQTPLGIVPLDRDIIELLIQKQSRIRYVPEAHSREHSLEIQLPFLQTVMPGLKLVPLVMGDQSYATCQWLADALAQCIRGRSTLIVASSDLSHFHSYEEARRLDQAVIDNVRKFNPQNLSFDLARGRCEACGGGPMITALLAARQLGADQAEILNYNNSGDVTGDRSRVVGYLAAALWKDPDQDDPGTKSGKVGVDLGLSPEDKALLHRIARAAIEAHCWGKARPNIKVSSSKLQESRGAFVTLHKNGELRGCIGHIRGDRPMAETVAEMAVAAAFQDRRFAPVTADELEDLDIEISVMTPLREITDVNEIEVGVHGIIVQQDGRSGLLLPQVATEYGWDRTELLQNTCRKAHLPADAWKDKETRIYTFSADVF